MAIVIINQQQDDQNPALWHFKISGPDTAAQAIRLADLSEETASPADWLAANQVQAQAAIDAGVIDEEFNEKLNLADLRLQIDNELAWIAIAKADIQTGIGVIDGGATLAQLRTVVKGLALIVDRVLGEQREELQAWKYVGRRLK